MSCFDYELRRLLMIVILVNIQNLREWFLLGKVNSVTKFMFIPKQSLEVYSGGLYENIIMENMWVEYEIAWQIEFSSSNLYNRIKMIHSNTYLL